MSERECILSLHNAQPHSSAPRTCATGAPHAGPVYDCRACSAGKFGIYAMRIQRSESIHNPIPCIARPRPGVDPACVGAALATSTDLICLEIGFTSKV